MNAIERAAELGAEHGKAAAQAWLGYVTTPRPWPPGNGDPASARPIYSAGTVAGALADGDHSTLDRWPVPDRSGAPHAYGSYPDIRFDLDVTDEEIDAAGGLDPWCDAYEVAFSEAVETTVRSASDSDQATIRHAVAGDEGTEDQAAQ